MSRSCNIRICVTCTYLHILEVKLHYFNTAARSNQLFDTSAICLVYTCVKIFWCGSMLALLPRQVVGGCSVAASADAWCRINLNLITPLNVDIVPVPY